MRSRRKAREAVLQALYHSDTQGDWTEQAFDSFFSHFATDLKIDSSKASICENYQFCRQLLLTLASNLEQIDLAIGRASDRWTLQRMAQVDRNILRIGAAELVLFDDIPYKVSINEAIELSKIYSAVDSPTFVNGVLDRLETMIKTGVIDISLFIRPDCLQMGELKLVSM